MNDDVKIIVAIAAKRTVLAFIESHGSRTQSRRMVSETSPRWPAFHVLSLWNISDTSLSVESIGIKVFVSSAVSANTPYPSNTFALVNSRQVVERFAHSRKAPFPTLLDPACDVNVRKI